ncbi:ATP-binding cassette domain-containing protein [Holdemanella sp.]|uniref:ATP-binding cassette domain-containing protein n=2 Tax=Holdemanella TaxID=1573535 RepID=UPI00159FDAA5
MVRYVLLEMRKQWEFFPFVFMLLASFFLSVISPYLNGVFLDFLTYNHVIEEVLKFSVLIATVGILGAIMSYFANMATTKILTKTAFSLLFKLTTHIEHMKLRYIEKQNAAYVTQRIFNDVIQVTTFVISNFLTAILYLIQMVGIAILFLYINPLLLILVVILLIPYILLFCLMKEPLYESLKQKKEADNSIFGNLASQINNVFYTQLNSSFEQNDKTFRQEFSYYLPHVLKANRLSYLFSSTDSVISTIFQSLMFIFGGIQIIYGKMSIGEFLMINSYFSLMLKSVKYFANIYKSYQDASSSYSRVTEFLQTPEMSNGNMEITQIQTIDIDKLSYRFTSQNGELKLFNDLSYSMAKGNVYAIVGANGSGKSTLLKILAGLYESENAIYINNHPLFHINMDVVRQELYSIVPQKLLVPSGTVQSYLAETLAVPKQSVSATLEGSCELKSYAESIMLLLDNECKTLSGGELRKLHLWLAVNKRSNVLFLDEPSTGLDEKSKEDLIDYLRGDPLHRIIVVMTHDSDMIKAADHILKINEEEEKA